MERSRIFVSHAPCVGGRFVWFDTGFIFGESSTGTAGFMSVFRFPVFVVGEKGPTVRLLSRLVFYRLS